MKLTRITTTRAGVKEKSQKLYASFMDWSGILRRLPLFVDRRASASAARQIDRLNSMRAAGETTLPADLARFIDELPPKARERLAAWGIIGQARVAAAKPLREHLDDYRAALLDKGNTQKHADLVTSRARAVFDACGFIFWQDLSAVKLSAHLAAERERGLSVQTSNHRLSACKQFAAWMVRADRASVSPLAHLQGLNVKVDRRHDRRAHGCTPASPRTSLRA